jgi:hypothetical protein
MLPWHCRQRNTIIAAAVATSRPATPKGQRAATGARPSSAAGHRFRACKLEPAAPAAARRLGLRRCRAPRCLLRLRPASKGKARARGRQAEAATGWPRGGSRRRPACQLPAHTASGSRAAKGEAGRAACSGRLLLLLLPPCCKQTAEVSRAPGRARFGGGAAVGGGCGSLADSSNACPQGVVCGVRHRRTCSRAAAQSHAGISTGRRPRDALPRAPPRHCATGASSGAQGQHVHPPQERASC